MQDRGRRSTAIAFLLLASAPPADSGSEVAGTEQAAGDAVAAERLARLRASPVLHYAAAILAPLQRGRPETPVIVTLRPSSAAEASAGGPPTRGAIPDARAASGGRLIDLGRLDIRRALRAAVADVLDRVIPAFESQGVSLTRRFSYQLGFAARVDAAGLDRLAAEAEVLRIEPDWQLEPHSRQGLALMKAELPSAYYDGSGVGIAIVDTGIDTAHPVLGGGAYQGNCDEAVPAMAAAAANAVAAGIAVFASSGNNGFCGAIAWPACISHVQGVGAVYDADLGQRGWCLHRDSCAPKEANAGCPSGYAAFETAAAGQVTAYSNTAESLGH